MSPIRLTDAELDAVMTAARPLAPHLRDAFLQQVADALASYTEIGPGIVARVCRDPPPRGRVDDVNECPTAAPITAKGAAPVAGRQGRCAPQ